jgi:hypothetical protein
MDQNSREKTLQSSNSLQASLFYLTICLICLSDYDHLAIYCFQSHSLTTGGPSITGHRVYSDEVGAALVAIPNAALLGKACPAPPLTG